MLIPPIYREDRLDCLHSLVNDNSFGTLVTVSENIPVADHIPFFLHDSEEDGELGTLRGHVAVANPVWKSVNGEQEVLVIFQGPSAYVTPNWYASKQEHGKVVPTWNYMVVHARGKLTVQQDSAWLLAHLNSLTGQHEAVQKTPWKVSDAPADFIDRQMRGIVGVEILITDLAGQWKLSQNKDAADYAGVVEGLTAGNSAVVEHMKSS